MFSHKASKVRGPWQWLPATRIILVYTISSGNRRPSATGPVLTKKLRQAGGFLDLPVLDYLSCTNCGYHRFADEDVPGVILHRV